MGASPEPATVTSSWRRAQRRRAASSSARSAGGVHHEAGAHARPARAAPGDVAVAAPARGRALGRRLATVAGQQEQEAELAHHAPVEDGAVGPGPGHGLGLLAPQEHLGVEQLLGRLRRRRRRRRRAGPGRPPATTASTNGGPGLVREQQQRRPARRGSPRAGSTADSSAMKASRSVGRQRLEVALLDAHRVALDQTGEALRRLVGALVERGPLEVEVLVLQRVGELVGEDGPHRRRGFAAPHDQRLALRVVEARPRPPTAACRPRSRGRTSPSIRCRARKKSSASASASTSSFPSPRSRLTNASSSSSSTFDRPLELQARARARRSASISGTTSRMAAAPADRGAPSTSSRSTTARPTASPTSTTTMAAASSRTRPVTRSRLLEDEVVAGHVDDDAWRPRCSGPRAGPGPAGRRSPAGSAA